jgi:hypothetical protein
MRALVMDVMHGFQVDVSVALVARFHLHLSISLSPLSHLSRPKEFRNYVLYSTTTLASSSQDVT